MVRSEQGQNQELVRCFVALELPREAINYIQSLQKLIRTQNLFYGKFTEPENLHLTLKFLGEIDQGKLSDVQARLKKIKAQEFETELGEAGVFSKRALRIIWIKLKSTNKLQKQIDDALSGLFEPERKFMSHLTIARVKRVDDRKKFFDYLKNMKIKKIKFKVKEFILKKSELMSDGPIYSDIEKYSLKSKTDFK